MLKVKVKNNLSGYISRLEDETTFKEFKNVMEVVRIAISGDGKNKPLIGVDDVKQMFKIFYQIWIFLFQNYLISRSL